MFPKLRILFMVSLAVALLAALPGLILAQGGVLVYGENATGSLSPTAPFAFYTFNGDADDFVEIQVIGITPDVQPSISLLAATQAQLATNAGDPYGLGDGTDARITYRLPATGLYSVLVSNTTGAQGDYLIRLRGTPASASTTADAGSTTVDVASGTSAQVFSFNANPDGPLTATVTTETPNFSFSVQVRDPQGQVVAVLTGDAVQGTSFDVPAGTGVYEVVVTPLSSGVTGIVTLQLGQVADAAPESPADNVVIPSATFVSPAIVTATPAATSTTSEDNADVAGGCLASSSSNVNLRNGPGTNFSVIGQLLPGTNLPVTGRSTDGVWFAVTFNQQTA